MQLLPDTSSWTCIQNGDVFTVGFYDSSGWHPFAEHSSESDALASARYLNGPDETPINRRIQEEQCH